MPLVTSPNDLRHYLSLTLANQLRVLLVSDPDSERSAAAIAVNAGQFHDPQDRPGMAHFVEHMLFLGTEAFPKPDEYHGFISQHGGQHNAWTGTEITNYFFDIEHDFFEPALQRFSRFFVCPTLNEALINKERQAIESEFRLKLQDETRRFYQVLKESVNPAHPFSKFSVGNLETLADKDNASVRPELVEFVKTHYRASNMTLVLYSQLDLPSLEALVLRHFSDIPDTEQQHALADQPLYRPQDLNFIYHISPIKELRKLQMTFALPETRQLYQQKPLSFISHLLGDEGPGSLLQILRQRGWITRLSAGGGISGYNFKNYDIEFGLTESGLAHYPQIVELTLATLRQIRAEGLQQWRYRERQQVLQTAFRYQEKNKPIDFASGLSLNMLHYEEDDWIQGDYMMASFDAKQIEQLLQQLDTPNLNLYLTAPNCTTDQYAPGTILLTQRRSWIQTGSGSCKPIAVHRRSLWRLPILLSARTLRPGSLATNSTSLCASSISPVFVSGIFRNMNSGFPRAISMLPSTVSMRCARFAISP